MLQSRSQAILYKILTDQRPVTIQQLSEWHKLSLRMIRYDLEAIDTFLKKNGLPILHKKGKIHFPGNGEELSKAVELTSQALPQNQIYLPADRLHQIISILLQAKNYITYEDIAQILDVSKSTVIKDLNKLRNFYPYHSAKVEVWRRRGIYFSGNEADIRESVVSFLFGRAEIRNLFFILQTEGYEGEFTAVKPLHIFHPSHLDRFACCIRSVANTLKIRIADNTFIRLLLYLTVASVRITSGHLISTVEKAEKTEKVLNTTADTDFLYLTEMIIAEISRDAPFSISASGEYEYLAGLMAYYFSNSSDNRAEIQILLLNLVNKVERLLGINLMEDMELLKTLDEDIQAIVGRKSLVLPLYEDIANQLPKYYPDVYESVGTSVSFIEEYLERQLSQEELTALMLPFAEAVQRNRTLSNRRMNILVVCSAGQAASRLLCYQLTSLFDVNIVDAIDFNRLRDCVKESNVDFIISTVLLKHIHTPSILVNPFLTSKDVEGLKDCLPTKVIDHNLFISLLEVIEKNCVVNSPKQLVEDIANLLSIKSIRQSESNPNLWEILKPENIRLDVKCYDWYDAVRLSGVLLRDSGYTDESYIEDMIESVGQSGPYMVIGKGIAMPHAGLKSVKQVGMSFVRLATPVNFGNPENDPVDLVFALCTPTKIAHLNALQQFANLIENEDLLEGIRKAKKVEEVIKFLKKI